MSEPRHTIFSLVLFASSFERNNSHDIEQSGFNCVSQNRFHRPTYELIKRPGNVMILGLGRSSDHSGNLRVKFSSRVKRLLGKVS